jgi:hypothetical protein
MVAMAMGLRHHARAHRKQFPGWVRALRLFYLLVTITAFVTWQVGLLGPEEWLWISFAIVVGMEVLSIPLVLVVVLVFTRDARRDEQRHEERRARAAANDDPTLNPPNRAQSKRRRQRRG